MLKAIILNCSLKPSTEASSTEQLAAVLQDELESFGVVVQTERLADKIIAHGVTSEAQHENDEWPEVYDSIVSSDILVVASPTWVGHPSSIAQQVLERLDGMMSETKDDGRPKAYDKVAGVVVVGNEDGAHHVISEISGALVDIGFTIPGQSWTYWNQGPGPGKDYKDTTEGHDWSRQTAQAAAKNLVTAAKALQQSPLGI